MALRSHAGTGVLTTVQFCDNMFYLRVFDDRTSPAYVIDAVISRKSLMDIASQFAGVAGGVVWIVNDTHDYLVVHGTTESQVHEFLATSVESRSGMGATRTGRHDYLVVHATSELLSLQLSKLIPIDVATERLIVYQTWLLGFTGVVVLMMIPFAAYIYAKVRRPLHRLMVAFSEVEAGDLDVRVDSHQHDEFDTVFRSFNMMTSSLEQSVHQIAAQRSAAKDAQLRQLQSQINPHFLYNSYFLLHRLIRQREWAHATDFSRMMGEYFQYITRSSSLPIAVRHEIEHARTYAEIQGMRFRGRISIEFGRCPDEALDLLVPPLILQPILENSFVHGLEDTEEDGLVRVSFNVRGSRYDTFLEVQIEDNGVGVESAALEALRRQLRSTGSGAAVTGLGNIRQRLMLMFGNATDLCLESGALGGLRVTMLLPVVTDEEVERAYHTARRR